MSRPSPESVTTPGPRIAALLKRRAELLEAEAALWREAATLVLSTTDFLRAPPRDLMLRQAAVERNASPDDGLVSLVDACRFLGISRSTLYKWRGSHCGPSVIKLGKRTLYRRKDLEALVASSVLAKCEPAR